jgi:hypothetical protein
VSGHEFTNRGDQLLALVAVRRMPACGQLEQLAVRHAPGDATNLF